MITPVQHQIRILTEAIGSLNHLQGQLHVVEQAKERAVNLDTIVLLNDRIEELTHD